VSTNVLDSPVDLDEVLYQSVVDDEFRAELLADPGSFGLSDPGFVFPAPVEAQDRTLLDLAAGSQFSAMCASTCSAGPFTIVCDGYTK
jgi:Family of unknown function (DUF5973)